MDSKAILSRMMSKDFLPDREALLEEEPPHPIRSAGLTAKPSHIKGKGKEARVEFISEANNRLVLQATAEEDSLLVLSDTYYPGWKAFVDGKKTKIYRANYTFRAIPLSAGLHRIEFVYDPLSFKLGALFTFLGIMGCAVIYVLRI
jgi:uncharacterized membrane protein YfhO